MQFSRFLFVGAKCCQVVRLLENQIVALLSHPGGRNEKRHGRISRNTSEGYLFEQHSTTYFDNAKEERVAK